MKIIGISGTNGSGKDTVGEVLASNGWLYISVSGDLLDVGIEKGVIKKNGNTYAFGEEKLGVGRESAKTYLRSNLKLMTAIRKQIMEEVKKIRESELAGVKPANDDYADEPLANE